MSPPQVPRYNVLGVGVSVLTLNQARDLIVGARGRKHLGYVCLCTANGVAEAGRDPDFRRIFNESWLTTADGMPMV
jgi:N-acetylglucosaminyldiphosphoundecaprenol N-acetyl-beta-D-mannosaminyltransferase